jgi:hypothetical protein
MVWRTEVRSSNPPQGQAMFSFGCVDKRRGLQ